MWNRNYRFIRIALPSFLLCLSLVTFNVNSVKAASVFSIKESTFSSVNNFVASVYDVILNLFVKKTNTVFVPVVVPNEITIPVSNVQVKQTDTTEEAVSVRVDRAQEIIRDNSFSTPITSQLGFGDGKNYVEMEFFQNQVETIYNSIYNSTTANIDSHVENVTHGGTSGIDFATIALGGTGISTVPNYGELLMGDGLGGYSLVATSSLGILGGGGSSQWTTAGSDINYTTGNVGIGTTTLNGRLTIEQTHDAQTVARISNFSDSANAYAELSVRAGNVTTYLGSTPQNSSTVTGAGSAGRGYVWSQTPGVNRGLDLVAALANSDLRFYTAGTAAANERMRITSTGDVGIGTTSPAYKLHVYAGTGSATQNIQTADASGEAAINLENTVRRWKLKATTAAGDAFVIRDQTAGQDRFVINGAGNIGIGSTSPYAKLSIAGTSIASTTLAIRPVSGQTANILDIYNTSGVLSTVFTASGNVGIGTANPSLDFGNSWGSGLGVGVVSTSTNATVGVRSRSSTGYAFFDQTNDIDQSLLFGTYGSSYNDGGTNNWFGVPKTGNSFAFTYANAALSVGTFGNRNLTLGTNNTARLTVLGSGNVGIGTTTPTSALHIDSGTASLPSISLSALGGSLQTIGRASASFTGAATTDLGIRFSNKLWLGNTGTASVVLDSAGNLGIGTTNPSGKLSVLNSQTASLSGSVFVGNPTISAVDTGAVAQYNGGGIAFGGTHTGTSQTIGAMIKSLKEDAVDGNYGYSLGLYSRANGSAIGNPGIILQGGGNVGIGTTSPVAKLSISGNSWSNLLGGSFIVADSSPTGSAVTIDSTATNGRRYSWLSTASGAGAGSGKFALVDNTAGGAYRMIFDSSGNVGIGTTSPYGLLHLSGNGAVPQLIISGTAAGSNMEDWRVVADSTSLFLGTLSENTTSTGDYAIRLGREASSNDVDYIEFATNNEANKMRFDGAGNLGIGTTSPQRLLSLYRSTSPVLQLANSISGSGVNDGFLLTQAGLDSYLENAEAGNLYFRTSATNRMTIDSSGNVGIGTTSPNAKLSIYSGAAGIYSVNAAADELVLENSGSGGMSIVTPDDSTGNIFFGSPSRQIGSQLSWNYNNLLMTIGTGMAGGQLQFLAGNAAEAMRINSSGNVGIGTTTPNAALNVNTTLTNGTPAFRISNSSTGPTWNGLVIDNNNASSIDARNWFIGANSVVYGDFNIRTGNARGENPTTSGTSRFYISETGNVGIGTTSPARKLHVESANADAARLRITETADSSSGHSAGIELFDTTTFKGGIFKNGLTHSIGLWDASSERLTVVQGGSIGIGTTTPVGNGLTISAASVPQLTFADQSLAAGTRNFLMRINPNIGTGVFQIGSAVDAGSANVINLNLDRSGNVGIGTTTPGANLDVNGTTRLGGSTVGVYPALSLNNKNSDASGVGTGLQFKNRNDASNYMGGIQTIYRGGITSALTMMDFFAGGDSVTPKMTLSGDGKLGIGTTTPEKTLTVSGSLRLAGNGINNGIFLDGFNASSTKPSIIFNNGNTMVFNQVVGNASGLAFNFVNANDASLMSIMQGGNVGIGTTTPDAKLHVAMSTGLIPTIAADTGSIVSNTTSSGSSAALSIISGATGFSTLNFGDTADENVGYIQYGHTNNYLSLGANTNEYMRLTSAGNIGIGTTSPYKKLSIADTSPAIVLSSINTNISAGATYGDIDFTSDDLSGPGLMARIRAKANDNNFGGDADFTFWTRAGGAEMSEKMRLTSFGGLNVGSTTAAAMLTVENITTRDSFVVTDQALDPTPFLIDNTGNVGIGTSTPGLAKTIIESSSNILSVLGLSNTSNTANSRTYLNFYDNTAENSAAIGTAREASATDWGLIFRTGSGNSSSGPSDRMYISATGNVGIGSTTPISALSVVSPGLAVTDVVSITGAIRNEGSSALKIAPTIQAATAAKNTMNALSVAPIFIDNISGVDVVDYSTIRTTAMTGGLAGAITNTYGLYVEPNTQGTNNYGAYIGGNVGIASTSPWRTLSVNGTVALNGLTSSATGNALCISSAKDVTDSGGASCTPSSIRFKENVTTLNPGFALDTISKLKVVNFDYIEKQPFETNRSYGLIAEEVAKIDNNLVDYGYDGLPVSLHFEKITGLLVQAVQEQKVQIEEIKSQSFIDKVFVGVNEMFKTAAVRMKSVFVGELHVQEKLCVDDVCIDKDQLKAILMNSGGVRYIQDKNPIPVESNTNTNTVSSTTSEVVEPQASTTSQTVPNAVPVQESTTPQVPAPSEQPVSNPTNTTEQTPPTVLEVPAEVVSTREPEPAPVPAPEPAPTPTPEPSIAPESAPTAGEQ